MRQPLFQAKLARVPTLLTAQRFLADLFDYEPDEMFAALMSGVGAQPLHSWPGWVPRVSGWESVEVAYDEFRFVRADLEIRVAYDRGERTWTIVGTLFGDLPWVVVDG